MSEPLLKILNHHSPSCGDPPIIDGEESNNYLGYFIQSAACDPDTSHNARAVTRSPHSQALQPPLTAA